ncbi:MAG: FkbM family methyltransferase [Candidatus Omnitrophota bacterium]|nr:MAG: FkbM family methyltransferase [Candidatus Omnitrophota bacterium]
MSCSLSVSRNFFNYYFVKWGLKEKSRLTLNTHPDPILFNINVDQVKYNKGLLKSIFRLVKEKKIKYYADTNKILVYSQDRKHSKEIDLDIDTLETVEKILSCSKKFEDIEHNLFMVELDNNLKFLIRKVPVADIVTLKETIVNEEYAFLYPYIEGETVLDIGAYIGDTSIMFCLKGAKNVVAYEPDPLLFNLCTRNINLNNMASKIEVRNYGVSDKESLINKKGYSFVKPELLFDKERHSVAKEIEMKILSFSKVIEQMKEIDVLKMDCEGAEFPAIISTPPYILKRIKAIGMECHANPEPLIDYLKKADFKVEIKKEMKTQDRYLTILFAVQEDN